MSLRDSRRPRAARRRLTKPPTAKTAGSRDKGDKNTVVRQTNYYPHGLRVTAWARQISLTGEEATPLLQEKLASAPAGLLP